MSDKMTNEPDRMYFQNLFLEASKAKNYQDKARMHARIYREICDHYEIIVSRQEKELKELRGAKNVVAAIKVISEALSND